MKIHIRERNVEVSNRLRAHVQRKLGFALGPFSGRIGRVVVHFSAGDGTERRCQIDVDLRPRSVCVEDNDHDLFAAVEHAADRLARSVARALQGEHDEARMPR